MRQVISNLSVQQAAPGSSWNMLAKGAIVSARAGLRFDSWLATRNVQTWLTENPCGLENSLMPSGPIRPNCDTLIYSGIAL